MGKKIMRKVIIRYLLISIGCLSILLGLIGIVVPLLPTTPFLILALACFARSSPCFHQRLLNAPYLGGILRDWEKEKKIDKKRKRSVYLIILVTFFISMLVVYPSFLLQLLLLLIMSILLLFIRSIDEK
ncbi:YbaN family protein [Psychromonas ossibalaenae]|uniref:YbaN family protein n=1 Tax=Psychromonas ossibalaenae TaxID=444922 RepID=UPI00036FE7C0|nr:YbaN family protein [Psychromonas ossibalaenae]